MTNQSHTILVGLGNPLMSDDAVGWRVAEAVHRRLNDPAVGLRLASVAGIELMELLVGYERAVVIDAIQTDGQVGELHHLNPTTLSWGELPDNAHRFGIFEGLELGRRLGFELPTEVSVLGVEVADPYTFAEGLTPELAEKLPCIVEEVLRLL